MLKAVSSITNAIGALNYKGTWDANANSPALASGVGTKGDYYVVSVSGTTTLNGISNWGVGDWAVFNGTVWQRVEGGADLNGVNLSVTGSSTLDGNVTFKDNLTQDTAGKGVNFSANSNAPGMTSELLNWYEEGTFTPTLGGTTTYTTQVGYYTRIGRQVTVQIVMTINALNTPTSAGQIRGLPFTSANDPNLYQSGSVSYWSGANTPAYWVGCFINPNSTVIDITSTTAGAQASANDPFAIFKDGTNLMLSLTYFV